MASCHSFCTKCATPFDKKSIKQYWSEIRKNIRGRKSGIFSFYFLALLYRGRGGGEGGGGDRFPHLRGRGILPEIRIIQAKSYAAYREENTGNVFKM